MRLVSAINAADIDDMVDELTEKTDRDDKTNLGDTVPDKPELGAAVERPPLPFGRFKTCPGSPPCRYVRTCETSF
jgi:hypothetical protein